MLKYLKKFKKHTINNNFFKFREIIVFIYTLKNQIMNYLYFSYLKVNNYD